MTPFRKSQARAVLDSIVRGLAPQMAGPDCLRKAVRELAFDWGFWAELERTPLPEPVRAATMQTSPLMEADDG